MGASIRRKSTSFEAKNESPHPQTSEPNYTDCLKTPVKMLLYIYTGMLGGGGRETLLCRIIKVLKTQPLNRLLLLFHILVTKMSILSIIWRQEVEELMSCLMVWIIMDPIHASWIMTSAKDGSVSNNNNGHKYFDQHVLDLTAAVSKPDTKEISNQLDPYHASGCTQ